MSKFDDCIQEGDEIIYSDSLGCRVNMSQLRRVAKPVEELSDEELSKRILFLNLIEIKENINNMTSGNFMHNKAAIKLKIDYVLKALKRLGIEEV